MNREAVRADLLDVPVPSGTLMDRPSHRVHDELLVLRCQDGEVSALEQLFRAWHPRLARRALQLCGSADHAQDAVSETWLAVVRGIGSLNDPAAFPGWVHRVLRNKCADESRGPATREVPADDEPAVEPSSDDPEVDAIRAALRRLPTGQRELLAMHYLDGLDLATIAGILELPVGTVKSRLHNARARLRDVIERTRT